VSASAIGYAESVELFACLALQIGRIRSKNVGRAFEDEDLRHRWVDVTKVFVHIKFCDVADGARQFDAWPACYREIYDPIWREVEKRQQPKEPT